MKLTTWGGKILTVRLPLYEKTEMLCEILRVIGGTLKAFLTELFGHTKDFEFSKCVSVVPPPYLQRYVAVLLTGP